MYIFLCSLANIIAQHAAIGVYGKFLIFVTFSKYFLNFDIPSLPTFMSKALTFWNDAVRLDYFSGG